MLFSYVFEPTAAESRRYGPGLLWIAFLFAGSLMLHPSFAREQTNDTLDALRMAPDFALRDPPGQDARELRVSVDHRSWCWCRCSPCFTTFRSRDRGWPADSRAACWARLGLVMTGTVFSAISAHARMRELLLPLLSAADSRAAADRRRRRPPAALFAEQPALDRTWVAFLAGFDIVFFRASWLLSNFLIEE